MDGIFPGSSPSRRSSFLPFAVPDIDESEIEQVTEALRSGWITSGPKTEQFEREFAARAGTSYAVAVNSNAAALHLSLEALGVQPGDEVITSPYAFASTTEVVRYFNAHPVFVDIDPLTFNLDVSEVEQAINRRTKAIIPVHMAGLPADLETLSEIAQIHEVPVVQDASHAFPCTLHGQPLATLSEVTCYCFYATKTLTTGEGGMICTDNKHIADRCRLNALHGIDRNAWQRQQAGSEWYYEILTPGFKYNMTDMAAAMGLAQLEKAQRMRDRRKQIADQYQVAFASCPALQIPADSKEAAHAWHLYMLRLNLEKLTIDRAEFLRQLKRENIGATVHFIPLHLHPYYRDNYGYVPESFPIAYREYLREISLPVYSRMTDQDVEDVVSAVLRIAAENQRA